MFGMFDGEEQNVKLLCRNDMVGVIIDRFGKDIIIVPEGKEHFTVNIMVAVSKPFFGWIISLGDGVKIVGPEHVIEMIDQEIERLIKQYR